MRVLIVFCLIVALAQAYDIDWSEVTRPQLTAPGFKDFIQNDVVVPFIFGGQDAGLLQFPYQICFFKTTSTGFSFCGGSLLDDEWVLTAAHCVVSPGNNITVVLGAHNISAAEPEQLRIKASEVIYHEGFDSSKRINDIAVIRLSEKVQFTERIQPTRLPRQSQASCTFEGFIGTISGWGVSPQSAPNLTDILQWERNPIISNAECALYFDNTIISSHICLSGAGDKSVCSGDSGGPLVITDTDGAPTQVGIDSFSSTLGCGIGTPDSFTRITSFLSWISEKTGILIEP